MPNFSFTQLRTHQITGTMADSLDEASGFDAIAASDGHLQKVLDHLASSLKRLHGGTSAISNEGGHLKAPNALEPYEIRSLGIVLSKYANGADIGGLSHDSSDNLIVSASASGKDIILSSYGSSGAPFTHMTADAGSGSVVFPLTANATTKGGLQVGDSRQRIFSTQGGTMQVEVSGTLTLSGSQSVTISSAGQASGVIEFASEPHSGFSPAYPGQPVTLMQIYSSSNSTVVQQLPGANKLSIRDSANAVLMEIASAGVTIGDGNDKLMFRDTGIFIHSPNDGELKISVDGSGADSFEVSAAGGAVIDVEGDIVLDANGGDVTFKDGGTSKVHVDMANAALKSSTNKQMSLGSSTSDRWNKLWAVDADLEADLDARSIYTSANLGVSGSAVFAGNVLISGSLDVTSLKTTFKTEEILEIEGARILASSGSNSAAADGAGYLIGGTDTADAVVAMVYDHSAAALEWKFAGTENLILDGGAALTPGSDAQLDLGSSGVEWKDLYIDGVIYADDIEADKLQIADTNQSHHLEIDWSEDDTGDRVLDIKVAGADRTLTLNEGFTIGDGHVGTLTFSAASKTLTVSDNAAVNQALLTTSSPTFSVVTASDGVQAQEVTYLDANASAGVIIKSPAVLAASYQLVLPSDDGSSGEVLRTDGSGNLSWTSNSGGGSSQTTRYAHVVSSSVSAGATYSYQGGAVSAAYSSVPSTRDSNGDTLAANKLQIHVNGQLMLSGTAANIGSGDADYTVTDGGYQLKFGFPLASGDVIALETVQSS